MSEYRLVDIISAERDDDPKGLQQYEFPKGTIVTDVVETKEGYDFSVVRFNHNGVRYAAGFEVLDGDSSGLWCFEGKI